MKHFKFSTVILLSILISCTVSNEKMLTGKYDPTWESLSQYNQAPEWFRDAKFGIWAHWGPQCQPGKGDWYAQECMMKVVGNIIGM